jgi:hypothetical protein
MTLERVGTPKKVFSQTEPAYEKDLVWIETDGNGNIVAQYVGKFDQFIEVENAAGYPIHFDHVGDAEPETREGDAWLETTAFSTVTVNTPTTGDNIYEFDIATLEDVFNVTTVTIIGERSTAAGGPVTISGGGTGSVDPAGTSTTDGQVVFTGVETTTSDSASLGTLSNGGSGSFTVGGNVDPRGESVTLTGDRSTTARQVTVTGTGSQSFSADGTSVENAEVTFTGSGSTNSRSVSNNVEDDQDDTITVGGNAPPEAEQLSVTNNGPGEAISYVGVFINTGDQVSQDIDVSNRNEISRLVVYGDVGFDSANVQMSVDGTTTSSKTIDASDDARTTFAVGPVDVSGTNTVTVQLTHNTGEQMRVDDIGIASLAYDFAYVAGPNFSRASAGESTSISLSTGSNTLNVSNPYGADLSYTLTFDEVTETIDPSLTVDGQTVTYSGQLSDGQTVTRSVSSLTTGSSTADVSVGSGPIDSASLTWTDAFETTDPSVSLAGNTVSFSGVLGDGQTHTESVSLSPGSVSASVTTAHKVGVDASWTQVDATENPSVSFSGSTASFAGILTSGQTATRSIDFGADSYTADVSVTNDCETEVTWTDVFETLDPSISLNGTTSQFTGLVPQGESVTVDVSKSSLTTGTNTLELASGGPAGLSFSYDEVDPTSSNLTVRLYYSDGAAWKEVP